MKRTTLKPISEKQEAEKARQRKLKKLLIMEGPHDSAGFPLCVKCGGRGNNLGLQLVHLKRLSDGGRTSRKNCQIWCAPCHFGKEGHKTECYEKPEPVNKPPTLSGYGGLRAFPKSAQTGSKK